jgi:hypothetical protein
MCCPQRIRLACDAHTLARLQVWHSDTFEQMWNVDADRFALNLERFQVR